MEKKNHLDELPIATLTGEQLEELRKAEARLNEQGNSVYLIAFSKETPSV